MKMYNQFAMIHVVFDRAGGVLKVFSPDGATMRSNFAATGDAWGRASNPNDGPHGHFWPIATGHYVLTKWESWGVAGAAPSEGYGQIYVMDLDDATKQRLIDANFCKVQGDYLVIGGIALPRGGLAAWGRSEIMVHGGGSNAPQPLAPMQPLCSTDGCTRVHNQDWPAIVNDLAGTHLSFPPAAGSGAFQETVVYSVIGDSPPATC
ncbi:MAG TPA: hypothetical protein VKB39_08155 [Candidatus Baltobacteraceae bacterium]|nr:hypothetical protein [Candidatus Baltobacteraceae bacterium]